MKFSSCELGNRSENRPVELLSNHNLYNTPFMRLGLVFLLSIVLLAPVAHAQDQGERQALKMSSTEYLQKLQYAQLYEQQRDATNAARIYGELYTVNPNDVSVFQGYVRSLVALKKYDDAEHIVSQRLKVDASLETLLLSARLEAWLNKRTEALAAFQKAELHVNPHECSSLFPIVYAMMEVSFNQDALQLLDQMRKTSSGDQDICSSQIAGLYLRLGEYNRASQEFIQLLKSGEGNVGMVEQRLAEYMTDSLSRQTVLSSLETEILSSVNDENTSPSRANLRLLAWLYEERKEYSKALKTIIQIDDLSHSEESNAGPELLQFADRARSEGALEAAAEAYTEASKRMKTNHVEGYYASSAELGSLKTWEAYYTSTTDSKDSILTLIQQYENFAANEKVNELALDALVHAGNLSYTQLFDLSRATKDYEGVVSRARNGLNDATRDAAFHLVDIAFALQDFSLANSRLQHIQDLVGMNRGLNDKEIRNHILYDRALGLYYQQNFDSASVLLEDVASDASSDFANDAIQLAGIIETANIPGGVPSLKLFAKADLLDHAHKYDEAEAAYRAIIDTQFNSPLADRAALRSAHTLVALGRINDALKELDSMQTKMIASPLLDVAAFQEAEIVEKNLHDKARAQKMYENFLERYPNSDYLIDARDRARKLRGDAF